ncbi:MAG: hypothetical protein RBT25_03525 [Lentisphaeria bacterium]|nr:hypothetical protein [Lentisphaeria bacterium]
MKPTLRFLSYCLVLAAALLCTQLQADFLVDLHINGAENPSLSFGEAAIAKENPFPPFSAMFGVADVCFAGKEDAPQYFDRLADDIRSDGGDDNSWTLVAKTNARVTWKKKNNNIPANLKIVWKDIKKGEFKEADIRDNASLSLKAGTTYTIKRGASSADVQEDSDPNTGYARKENGVMQPVKFQLPAVDAESLTLRLAMNAGSNSVRYKGEDGKDNALWEADFSAAGYSVAYSWDNNVLVITLSKTETRAAGDWELSMTPQNNSAAPMSITDDGGDYNIANALQAIVLKFGTLDFDGDGVVKLDDVMYLLNFFQAGMPQESSNATIENNNVKKMLKYTSKQSDNPDDLEVARNVLATLREDTELIIFDGKDTFSLEQVMYFLNFFQAGMPSESTNATIENNNIKKILKYTNKRPENPEDLSLARDTMNNLRELRDNLE